VPIGKGRFRLLPAASFELSTPDPSFTMKKSRSADATARTSPITLVNLRRRNELRITAFEHAPAHPLDGVDDRIVVDVIERLQQNR
jgi:hypothetical protein